jgi:hypothetical protein
MRGDPDFCDQCEDETGQPSQHDQTFRDSATGRHYCTEHVLGFASWLMDGQPEELFANCLPGSHAEVDDVDDDAYVGADGSFSVRGGKLVPRETRMPGVPDGHPDSYTGLASNARPTSPHRQP